MLLGFSPNSSVRVRKPAEEIYKKIDEDSIISSPEKMYMLSLSTREKLPERLHKAMLLFSFDPNSKLYVQMYLDWSSHCEDMENSRITFERRRKIHDRIILGSIFLCGFFLILVLLMGEVVTK